MNNHETLIYENLKNIQENPGEILRDKILTSAQMNAAPVPYRRRFGIKTVLIAAVIAAVTTTTAFAYSDDIMGVLMRITTGNMTAEQMKEPIPGRNYVMIYEVVNEVEDFNIELLENGKHINFSTFEEASENAKFNITVPAFLPEGMELEIISVNQSAHHAVLTYYKEFPSYSSDGSVYMDPNYRFLFIYQTYVGQDAYLDIKTIYPVDTIMVGDIEAFLLDRSETLWTSDENFMWIPNLLWIKDGIFYNMTLEGWDGIDSIETIITIAESIG